MSASMPETAAWLTQPLPSLCIHKCNSPHMSLEILDVYRSSFDSRK